MGILHAHMYVYHVCAMPMKPEEGLGPLEEQVVLLTASHLSSSTLNHFYGLGKLLSWIPQFPNVSTYAYQRTEAWWI